MSTLDNFRKAAKRWLKAIRQNDADALARLRRAYPAAPAAPTLRDVQHALARERGHENWIALSTGIDDSSLTPLDHAAAMGDEAAAQRLLDAGARMTLPAAILLGRQDEIQRIVRENPGLVSTEDRKPWAKLLVFAATRSPKPVIERLLRTLTRHRAGLSVVNATVDAPAADGTRGFTALHAAAFTGNDEAVEVLLAHGANPRLRDGTHHGTPARWAAYAGHAAIVHRILGADIDIFDAIDFDRGDLVGTIIDRDPGALDRPFKQYAPDAGIKDGQRWPTPECLPLEWARECGKDQAAHVLVERGAGTRTPEDAARAERVVMFLQSACWDHHISGGAVHRTNDRNAQRLLAANPSIARESLYTAIVCGEREEVARIVETNPALATARGGPRGWSPILYLAFTRFSHPRTAENALSIARLLLDRGADPNDFYAAGDSGYTVLTGIAGEGEQNAPRQPYAAELFQLLLERGADPFPMQVLYNTHFSGDMLWWLELVHAQTINTPRGAAWVDPEWTMFDMGAYGSGARFILEVARKTRKMALAEWALARGANPDAAPARDRRFPKRTLYECAAMEGQTDMAELLARHGAVTTMSPLDDHEAFRAACLQVDRERARHLATAHPELLAGTALVFEAARLDRPDALALLAALGVSLDRRDRTNKSALHEAAMANALRAAAFLIDHGVEADAVETSYGAAPIGWADHGDHPDMVEFLSQYSRHIWTLSCRGYINRVRHVLAEDPSRARAVAGHGTTPLWWLPDDETAALELARMFVTAGTDPAARNKEGQTAADSARRRGMTKLAAYLDNPTA